MSIRSSPTTSDSEEQNVQRKERYSTEQCRPFTNYEYSSDLKNWSILNLLTPAFASQIYMIMAFEDDKAALIATKDRMVYGIGKNCNGRLGIGDATYTFQPKKVEALSGKNIKTFCCDCYNHDQYRVFALTEDGEVYSWGFNSNKGLGLGLYPSKLVHTPIRITSLSQEHIIDIACSKMHTIALTNDGKVYTWGIPEYIQLANDFEDSLLWQVKHKFNGKKIIHITCGDGFNMVLSNSGKVYSWGINAYGQLGLGHCLGNWTYPRLIASLKDTIIVKIACGSAHTLALTAEGEIYTWGKNTEGQLGDGNVINRATPIRVNVPEMGIVSDIAVQSKGSIAINKNGKIDVWGKTIFAKKLLIPTVTLFSNICDIIRYKRSYIIQNLFIDHRKGESDVLARLGEVFDDPLTSDLTIIVEGQPIYVHKTILKIRSFFFRNMFQLNWMESDKKLVVHNRHSYIVYRAFLKYLYTGVIDLSFEKVLDLLKLADEYGETNLKRYCFQMIKEGITVSNVIFIYTEAMKYNSKELEEFCFQYALSDLTKIVQTENFTNLFPLNEDLLNFIIKAAKAGAFKN